MWYLSHVLRQWEHRYETDRLGIEGRRVHRGHPRPGRDEMSLNGANGLGLSRCNFSPGEFSTDRYADCRAEA